MGDGRYAEVEGRRENGESTSRCPTNTQQLWLLASEDSVLARLFSFSLGLCLRILSGKYLSLYINLWISSISFGLFL